MKKTCSMVMVLLVITLTGLAPWSGCSSETEYTAQDFAAQYGEAYCKYLMYCCDSKERSFGSLDNCRQDVDTLVQMRLAFQESATPFAAFVPAAAQHCIETLQEKKCVDPALLAGCLDQATRAQHTAGESCTYNAECDSFLCVQPQKNTPGTCGMKGSGICNADDAACTAETFCGSDKQCQPKLAEGTRCARGVECLSGVCSQTSKFCDGRLEPFCDGK